MALRANTRTTTLALFIAMAVALHWVESFLPSPLPFLRLGLANILTLCALYLFGGPAALVVTLSRVVIGCLMAGSLFTPAFFFALGGGLASALVMWALPKGVFSPIGVSIAGACAHMATQLLLAAFLIRHVSLLKVLPLFLLVSVITGILNGYCARLIMSVFRVRRIASVSGQPPAARVMGSSPSPADE